KAVINRGLSADRTIYLRKERRRDVDIRNTAQVSSRHEAGQVSHDAPAERDDRVAPLEAFCDEKAPDSFSHPERLGSLAIGDEILVDGESGLSEAASEVSTEP